MKGRAIKYTRSELDFIYKHREVPRRELTEMVNAEFGTSHTLSHIKALCSRKGWMTGRTGCFTKGHVPHPNAGLKGPNKTSFQKGHRPQTWVPVGSEAVDKNGYLKRKIADTGIKKNDWVHVHRQTWEKHHGRKVPEGHIVIFVDGNNRNFEPENLRLISRADNAILNKYKLRNVQSEVKPAAITYGQLVNKTRQMERSR